MASPFAEMRRKLALMEKGELTPAAALGLRPSHACQLEQYAASCAASADFSTAAAAALLATTADPDSANAWLLLGNALGAQRKASAAIVALERVVAIDPAHLQGWVDLGEASLALLDYAAAARALTQAIALDPHARTPQGLRAQMLVVETIQSIEGT